MVRSFNDFVFISRLKKIKQPSSASKKDLTHPKYLDMIVAIIKDADAKDDNRMGLSKSAILKKMREAYDVGINERFINTQLNLALKRGLAKDVLKMAKKEGKGSGHYKLVEKSHHKSKISKNMKVSRDSVSAAKMKSSSATKKSISKSKRASIEANLKVAKKTGKKVTKAKESAAGIKLDPKPNKTVKAKTNNLAEIVKTNPKTIKERMKNVEAMNEFNLNYEDDIFACVSAKPLPKILLSQDSESEVDVSIQVARTPIQAYKGKRALLPIASAEDVSLSPMIPNDNSCFSQAAFLQNKVTEKRKGYKELAIKSKPKKFGQSTSRKKQDLVMNERRRDIGNIITNFTANNQEESEDDSYCDEDKNIQT